MLMSGRLHTNLDSDGTVQPSLVNNNSQTTPPRLRFNFAKGHPNNAELPVNELQHLMALCAARPNETSTETTVAAAETSLRRALQYGQEDGNPELITQLRLFLDRQCAHDDYGRDDGTFYSAAQSSFFVTEGVSHGLDLLARAVTRPGDVVWTECPTYYLAAGIFRSHGLTIQTLPMKSAHSVGGLDVTALAHKLATLPPHCRPCLIYIIPAHQNPTGHCLSSSDRQQLADLAYQYQIVVVADEVYHLLDWNNDDHTCNSSSTVDSSFLHQRQRPARMVAWNPPPTNTVESADDVPPRLWGCVSVSSFTKIFAPGVRCGWIEAPPDIVSAVRQVGYIQSQGAVGPVMGAFLARGLSDGTMDKVLQRYRDTYQRRCNLLCRILAESSFNDDKDPESNLELVLHPTGGYFVWLRFPVAMGHVDGLLDYCIKTAGVSFMPGPCCDAGCDRAPPESGPGTAPLSLDQEGTPNLAHYGRLCFAKLSDAEIKEGATLLVECFQRYIASMNGSKS
jgi:2-aminoadipate transaminase